MGLIELIQGFSLIITIFLWLFVCNVGKNLANIILFLAFGTFFTPIIGVPLYYWIIKQ